jgi:hypothetical protein
MRNFLAGVIKANDGAVVLVQACEQFIGQRRQSAIDEPQSRACIRGTRLLLRGRLCPRCEMGLLNGSRGKDAENGACITLLIAS